MFSAQLAQLRSDLGSTAEILDDSTLTRALYSSDASLYRVPPTVVARPRTTQELVELAQACLRSELPITTRGAGTSCAGNAVGEGIVIDVARHLNQIHAIDAETKTAVIDPGWSKTNSNKPQSRTDCGWDQTLPPHLAAPLAA